MSSIENASMEAAAKPVPPEPAIKQEEKEQEGSVLEIVTEPEAARVFLNEKDYGRTPLLLKDMNPGIYRLSIRKAGYHVYEQWIEIKKDAKLALTITLAKIVGFLSVKTTPEHSIVYVDNIQRNTGISMLPVGSYAVRIRAFGYEDYATRVQIRENEITSIEAVLEKAPFSVRNVVAERAVFNPRNPGILGKTRIGFEVTTYGKGTLRIEDSSGKAVWFHEFTPFTDWLQIAYWDGKDSAGAMLPDGEYRAIIEAEEDSGISAIRAELPVRIDSSAVIGLRSVWSGVAGLLFVPTPDTLPAQTFGLSSLALVHIRQDTNAAILFRLPFSLGTRFSPLDQIEIDIKTNAVFYNQGYSSLAVGVGAKYQITKSNADIFRCAVYTQGVFQTGAPTDSFTDFIGFTAGFPAEFVFGPVHAVFAPSLTLSPYSVSYSIPGFGTPEFSAWAYARAGLYVDFGFLMTGLSFAARTKPFAQGFSFDPPFYSALEAHCMIPETVLFLSGGASLEFTDANNYFLSFGGGIGFVY